MRYMTLTLTFEMRRSKCSAKSKIRIN